MRVHLHPLAALLLAAGALGSVGCTSLTEPNDIEVTIVAEAPPAAPAPPPAPAAPAPGGGRMPNTGAPAGGG